MKDNTEKAYLDCPELAANVSVLVVEDSRAELSILEVVLRNLGYKIHTAHNGIQALQVINKHTIDIVLSDWRMPGMDGFTLCQELHKDEAPAPYFILLTARDAKCDLVAAMDAGADDFISKPYNREELRVRLKAGQRIISMRKAIESKHQLIEQTLQREQSMHLDLQRDLQAAEKLQRSLLPRSTQPAPGLALAHYFRAVNGVAGDAFNVLPLNERLLAFYHIDVAGHGVRAAMHSFNISQLLSANNESPALKTFDVSQNKVIATPPHRVIAAMNARFQEDPECQDYYTMIYGVLDSLTGRGVFSQAGMPQPILLQQSGQIATLGKGGFPVGMFAEATYEDCHFTLREGDRLIIHSDGILSCQTKKGQPLDQARLFQWMKKLAELPMARLHKMFPELMNRAISIDQADDDISLMILERCRATQRIGGLHADNQETAPAALIANA